MYIYEYFKYKANKYSGESLICTQPLYKCKHFMLCVCVYILTYIKVNLSVIVSSRILTYVCLRTNLCGSKRVGIWQYIGTRCILEILIDTLF